MRRRGPAWTEVLDVFDVRAEAWEDFAQDLQGLPDFFDE
jgi:hypothetical protein